MTDRGRSGPPVEPYRLAVVGPVDRRISEVLPEPVAAAVVQFITGDLLSNPRRLGKPLVGPLEGIWSARRGEYRVLYEINEETRTVTVVDVSHRSDIYGRRGRRPRR